MELQRVNVLSLAPREQKKKDVLHTEPESVRERLQETNDRLSQPVKAFKIERSKISSACFDLERLVVFVGLTTGRIGVWYRDPSKFGNIEDFVKEGFNILHFISPEKHKGEIRAIKCKSLNKQTYVFTGSVDHSVKVWAYDAKGGINLVQTLVGHDGTVVDLEFFAERDILITISVDKTMKVWRQDAGKQLLLHPWFIFAYQIKCPDDIYSMSLDTKDKMVKQRILSNHFTSIQLKIDELDAPRLLCGDLIGNVHMLKYHEEKKFVYIDKTNLGIHKLMINCVHLSSSDNIAYTCSYDQEICAFDVHSGKEFFKYKNPQKTHFVAVKWNPGEQELIAVDEFGYAMFINVKGEKGNHVEQVTKSKIVNLDMAPRSPYIFIATEDDVLFYKINKGFQVQKLNGGHQGPVIGLFYLDFKKIHGPKLKTTSRLISIGDDNTIRVWDTVDQSEMACFSCPAETEVTCMEYLVRFGLLATGHENGDLYLWDIEIGNKIKLKHKDKTLVDTICCLGHLGSGEYNYLFAAGYSGKVQVWEFTEKGSTNSDSLVYPQLKNSFYANPLLEKEKSGEEILALATCSYQPMASKEFVHLVFAAGTSKDIYISSVTKNAAHKYVRKFSGHEDTVTALKIDNRTLFSSSEDKTIKVWDIESELLLHTYTQHKGRIHLLLNSGRLLISASTDGIIYFHDYPTQKLVTQFRKKEGKVCSLAFGEESRILFIGSEEENVLKINLDDLMSENTVTVGKP